MERDTNASGNHSVCHRSVQDQPPMIESKPASEVVFLIKGVGVRLTYQSAPGALSLGPSGETRAAWGSRFLFASVSAAGRASVADLDGGYQQEVDDVKRAVPGGDGNGPSLRGMGKQVFRMWDGNLCAVREQQLVRTEWLGTLHSA